MIMTGSSASVPIALETAACRTKYEGVRSANYGHSGSLTNIALEWDENGGTRCYQLFENSFDKSWCNWSAKDLLHNQRSLSRSDNVAGAAI